MAEEIVAIGPVRPAALADSQKYRERTDLARAERHQKAALAAAELFRSAAAAQPIQQPVWLRAVTLLMHAIQADCSTVMFMQGPEARRCRITSGGGLEGRPSRRWPPSPPQGGGVREAPTRVEIERLHPAPTPILIPGQPAPGATSSFHTLLYAPRVPQPLGCLSLYSSADLALAADRMAFIDAVADLLARELVDAALPDPTTA